MESTNIQARITFRSIEDVRLFMTMVVDELATMQRAAGNMARLGVAANSPSMDNARKDTRNTAELLISVYQEFKRLHPVQCKQDNCTVGDEEINDAIESLRALVEEIDKSQKEADAMPPMTEDQERADMLSGLASALGIDPANLNALPLNPFEGPATIGGDVPDTRDASSGTGMYL